jgi:hypothetical protein
MLKFCWRHKFTEFTEFSVDGHNIMSWKNVQHMLLHQLIELPTELTWKTKRSRQEYHMSWGKTSVALFEMQAIRITSLVSWDGAPQETEAILSKILQLPHLGPEDLIADHDVLLFLRAPASPAFLMKMERLFLNYFPNKYMQDKRTSFARRMDVAREHNAEYSKTNDVSLLEKSLQIITKLAADEWNEENDQLRRIRRRYNRPPSEDSELVKTQNPSPVEESHAVVRYSRQGLDELRRFKSTSIPSNAPSSGLLRS